MTHFSIKFFLIYAVSIIVFKGVNLSFLMYLLLLGIGWGISLAAYPCRKNVFYQRIVLSFVIANFLGFVTAGYDDSAILIEAIDSNVWIRLLLAFLTVEFTYALIRMDYFGDSVTIAEQPELYDEHSYDLQRLKGMLVNTPILGIDSSWGNGKSFVVDYLAKKADIQEAYFVIKMEVLAYQFEEFDSILIHKLDALLQENDIFSIYSEEIKEAADKSLLGRVLYYFFRRGDSSRTSTFESLKTSLDTLPKKVLIIYEDLERVGKPDLIKRLFAISERLVGQNVQVIYEYDGQQLDEQGLKRAYREKYIPLEMNLTPIRYESMIEYVWDELQMGKVDRTVDFGFAKSIKEAVKEIKFLPSSNVIPNVKVMTEVEINKNNLTVRKIKIFLLELKAYLEAHDSLEKRQLEIVLAFYFLKNFMYDQFQCLKVGKPLEETFMLPIGDQTYTLQEVAIKFINEDFKNMLKSALMNQEAVAGAYFVYRLFHIDMLDYYRRAEANHKKKEISQIEWLNFHKMEEQREKTNRLIWNLLSNGESEYTNAEACVRKFEKDVLNVPRSQQQKAWNAYFNDLYNGKVIKNNTTIFKMGNEPMLDMAKALYVIETSPDIWDNFIFFLKGYWYDNHLKLNHDFIKIYQYIPTNDMNLYISGLKVFLDIPIEGNFNNLIDYYRFLSKYISAISKLRMFRTYEIESFITDIDITYNIEIFIKRIECVIKRLEKEKNKFDCDTFHDDVNTILDFLRKNIQIMQSQKKALDDRPQVNIQFSSERVNQKVIDEIFQILSEDMSIEEKQKKFEEAINKAYTERKLTYDDVQHLQNKWNL